MSRTDKTNPPWLKAEWWEPCHRIRCVNEPHHAWNYIPRSERVECDLPPEPSRHGYRTNWPRRHNRPCTWEPMLPSFYTNSSKFGQKTWGLERYVHKSCNIAERTVRAEWRASRQQFLQAQWCCEYERGCMCLLEEIEPPDARRRSSALYDRW